MITSLSKLSILICDYNTLPLCNNGYCVLMTILGNKNEVIMLLKNVIAELIKREKLYGN